MEVILSIFGIFFAAFIAGLFRGYVIFKLWAWFLVPIGVHPITIPIALGISLIVSILTYQMPKEGEDSPEFGKVFFFSLIYSAMALGLGWVYTLFM